MEDVEREGAERADPDGRRTLVAGGEARAAGRTVSPGETIGVKGTLAANAGEKRIRVVAHKAWSNDLVPSQDRRAGVDTVRTRPRVSFGVCLFGPVGRSDARLVIRPWAC